MTQSFFTLPRRLTYRPPYDIIHSTPSTVVYVFCRRSSDLSDSSTWYSVAFVLLSFRLFFSFFVGLRWLGLGLGEGAFLHHQHHQNHLAPTAVNDTHFCCSSKGEGAGMNHLHHGDMGVSSMGGAEGGGGDGGGGGMGGMGGGMPVAFVWDTKVTLYYQSWSTETTFEYIVALVGVFALCVAQEGLYCFRTAYTISPVGQTPSELTTPILPKPYKCVSLVRSQTTTPLSPAISNNPPPPRTRMRVLCKSTYCQILHCVCASSFSFFLIYLLPSTVQYSTVQYSTVSNCIPAAAPSCHSTHQPTHAPHRVMRALTRPDNNNKHPLSGGSPPSFPSPLLFSFFHPLGINHLKRQGARAEAAGVRYRVVRVEPRVELPHHAGCYVVQWRLVSHGRARVVDGTLPVQE